MSTLDSDTVINMKIQEQMKRYELNKQLKESLDEQQKNHIKQQVWDQLFNKSANSTSSNPQQSFKLTEAPSFNEEDAWQQRKSFVSQIQRSNIPVQTKTNTLNQNWYVEESHQTDQNEEVHDDEYVYEEEEEYQGEQTQWQNDWDHNSGSIVQSNIQASRAQTEVQQSSSQYPKLQFIDKWYEDQTKVNLPEQSQFPTVSKLPGSNLKESMAPEEKYALKQKQSHFKATSNVQSSQATEQKQEFLSQFLINKQPQFIDNISTFSREEFKEVALQSQKQSLLDQSKQQGQFFKQSQASVAQQQSQHFKNWKGGSVQIDNQAEENFSVSKQASFMSRQQNESRDNQYANQISQMQSKIKAPSFVASNYEPNQQRNTENSQISKPANSFLNITNPYLNKFDQNSHLSELERSYEMGRTQSKIQSLQHDYRGYQEDPEDIELPNGEEEDGNPYQYDDENVQNNEEYDYQNRERIEIIDSLHENPPNQDYEDAQGPEEQQEEPQNKFIQFEIGLDQSDADIKKRKFEMLKRKKMEEMERAKQERQKRRLEEQNDIYECNTPVNKKSYTPQRERSPVMPSSKSRMSEIDHHHNRQTTPKSTTPTNPKTLKNEKVNIFQEDPQDKYNHFQMNRQRPPKDDNQIPPRQNPKNPFRELGSRPASGRPVSGLQAPPPQTEIPQKGSRNGSQNRQMQKPELTPTLKSKKNNKMMLKNAITNVCLAGEPNKKERQMVLEQFENLEAEHFIILLKGQFGRMDLKAIYGMQSQDHPPELLFQCQKSPIQLDPQLVHQYFKYDSGAKEFKPIAGNKNFSYVVDAVKLRK